ncbi:hypothetical protein F5Y01DRAFT_325658 [Xylaria sp. FL0043]|nr:hypothetical protein F5Y01DRAFT_325658 [Xylaria sp. FL0043]
MSNIHYNQQPQQQQPQPQTQQQRQQQHYNQITFHQNPQPQTQPQPHRQQHHHRPATSATATAAPPPQTHQQQQQHVRAASIHIQKQPAANYLPSGSNNHIHASLHSQPQSPALNGAAQGSLQPRPLQTMTTTPIPAATAASNMNTSPAIPPSTATATSTTTTTTTALPTPDSSDPQRRRRSTGRPSKRRRSDNDAGPPFASSLPAPPRQPTVQPLCKGPYDTLEDAIFALQLHVFSSGYGVSQKRTVKEKLPSGKYDPDGDIIRKDFACDKGGNEFVSQSRGERRRESKKCGCPWKAAIRRLRREGDRWFIEILETQHNHPVTAADEMHTLASYRRWQRENNAGIRSAIARLTRAAAMPARDIAAYLKGDIQDHELDRIDKQILRALSMNDSKEIAGTEKDSGSVVFEMVARRPVIILQDNDRTSSTSVNDHMAAPTGQNAPLAPMNNFTNLTTPSNPFNGSPANYRPTFTNAFTNQPPNPNPQPNPSSPPLVGADGTTSVQSEYPAIS